MINKLRELLSKPIELNNPTDQHSVQLAAAALLVEVMVADEQIDAAEQQTVSEILETLFGLSATDIAELFEEAHRTSQAATSLYQFTRLINDHYRADDRYRLVVNLWRVAYADGHLDKYEEGVIRRICELIYVSHSDFIRAKHQARDEL